MTTGGEVAATAVPDTLGWLLALRAAERLDGATHVRLTGHVASPGGWDEPTRRRVASAARDGAMAVVDGVPVTERVAERRWLAWFPRPVGPRHAVNLGGPSVARLADLPDIRLVRAHLTASSWRAELLQAAANLAGSRVGDRLLERWVARGRKVVDADVRWACVVEVTVDERQLVRAWAHGWAPVATGVVLAEVLGPPATPPEGAVASDPATAPSLHPRDVLDRLATRTDMRWSLAAPESR